RTSEFLWQEGHTAHETRQEAEEEALRMVEVYRDVVERHLCVPVLMGLKSEAEKFAGAVHTLSIEAMMQDKKALQAGTSHYLGQNFAKAFDVQFQNREGKLEHVYATSWGTSTRLVGAVIMTHSDDKGLVLPPSLAVDQVVIVPILRNDSKVAVIAHAEGLLGALKAAGVRARLDSDDSQSPGWKFAEWEMRGVPLRVEVGPKDMAAGHVMFARRDTGEKFTVPAGEIGTKAVEALEAIQKNLFERAKKFRDDNTHVITNYDDMKAFFGLAGEDAAANEVGEGTANAKGGFADALWCGDSICEARLKAETKATIRCLPHDRQAGVEGSCALCGAPARHRAIFARAY
ncbi:MAG: His/Gly/Thr/Pro-type tRNA ligase C-terminal domain-containing protein, partial [Spirochaetota bacterium]